METVNAIMTRRSIRRFTDEKVDDELVRKILEAGMAAPSCANTKDWSFIVVTERETLNKMADANGHPARLLKTAPMAILVCGDLSRSFPMAKDYWIIDGAIAAENMALCAHGLGLGCVWLGTWPQMDRVKNQSELFGLPEDVIPHSILAFGHPAENPKPHEDVYEESRVHFEKW